LKLYLTPGRMSIKPGLRFAPGFATIMRKDLSLATDSSSSYPTHSWLPRRRRWRSRCARARVVLRRDIAGIRSALMEYSDEPPAAATSCRHHQGDLGSRRLSPRPARA